MGEEKEKIAKNHLKVICLLLIVLVGVSTWAVTLYQREAALRADFEELQTRYVSLDQSYGELSTQFKELTGKFQNLTWEYGNLTGSYSLLLVFYSNLTENYGKLMGSYQVLTANYSALTDNYGELQDRYFALYDLHEQLEGNYTELHSTYLQLLEQFQVIYEPLDYVVTPTTDEVVAWLEVDDTDNASYVGGRFTCGDFTVNLMLHAKENHWRILFTVIEFDFYSENPNGTLYHHGLHAHAFASIFTTEGIIYVEPQTDLVFYLYYEWDPETHIEFPEWIFIDTGPWLGTIFTQYYNRMGLETTPISPRASPHCLQIH
jgi:hypothetical protein